MKKLISFIFAISLVFALSVTVFGAEEPFTLFKVSNTDEFTAEYIVSYAESKGFDGIVLDLTGKESAEFYNELSKAAPDKSIFVMGELSVLSSLPNEARIILDGEISESDLAALSEKHGKEKTAFFIPFEDEAAVNKAKKLQKYFSVIFIENEYSSHSDFGYEEYALKISEQFEDIKVITFNNLKKIRMPSIKGDYYRETFELNSQYLINKINGFGFCVDDFSALIKDRFDSASYLTSYFGSKVLEENADFSVSQRLEITRPTGNSLRVETYKYTIFGTSDPAKPLYMNGTEVERTSESGLFAVTVDVPKNGKTFTFTQGGNSDSVTLSRSGGSSGGGSGTTTNLSSCYPSAAAIVRPGETVNLSCVAPSGGKVTAKINGETITLKQVAYANDGVPATFKGSYTVSGEYPENEASLIGKVTYTLKYNGSTKTKESSGTFYYIGEGANFAVKASVNLAGVEVEAKEQGLYLTTLRTGCVDYVTEITDNGWFKVSCGGYMKPAHCEIVTGNTDIKTNIASTQKEIGPNYEKFIMSCDNFPAFKGEIKGKALVLTLYNTNYQDLSSINLDCELMRRIVAVENPDGSVTLNFYANEELWGWDIFTDSENKTFSVVLQGKPKLSDIPGKPLTGITITVCAGHGGIDPGALSVAGEKGVNEADINRANCLMIIESLENLGATVLPLIEYEGKLDTYGRTDPARYAYSDIYICSHANSVAENADANLWCGTYVYYHYDHSAEFAEKLCDYISEYTGRDNEGAEAGYYSVTRLTMCPAVMLEVGFVSNPKEMDSLIDQRDIQKTALAVTRAVLEILDK